MKSLRFLISKSGLLTARFVVASVLACVVTGVLIGVILTAAQKAALVQGEFKLFFLFVVSFVGFILTRKYILDCTTDSVEEVISQIRIEICEQLARTDLSAFETLEQTVIQQTLGKECQVLTMSASGLMLALTSGMVIIAAFFYIVVVSPASLPWLCGAIAVMVFIHLREVRTIKAGIRDAAVKEGEFFQALQAQLQGFKELRMDESKAKDLLDNDLVKTARQVKGLLQDVQRKLNRNLVFIQASIYVLLGMVVFVLPGIVDQRQIPTATIASLILFISGPITSAADSAKLFFRANESLDRIMSLQSRLTSIDSASGATPHQAAEPFAELHCQNLEFHYPAQPGRMGDGFQLGPLELKVNRGEIVFLVGGNGSGKSTLLHLLCGLYAPSRGIMQLNGKPVTSDTRARYRAFFSIILQDFHLFHRLLGHPQIDRERIRYLLDKLNLRGLTDIDEQGRLLNMNLSTGQKKRLALLTAECDDREVFVFDEWAADQDPEFRQFFYESYLPDMRARGKTILAATHDDKYFGTADRVFKLDRGQMSTLVIPRNVPPT